MALAALVILYLLWCCGRAWLAGPVVQRDVKPSNNIRRYRPIVVPVIAPIVPSVRDELARMPSSAYRGPRP